MSSRRPASRLERHPLYGDIPMIRKTHRDRGGRQVEWWEYDPEFEPRLPGRAVRGTPSQQVFCALHHVPKYFYVDESRRCVECRREFTFAAREQRYWYEILKFNFNSVPIRCPHCRKRRRTAAGLRNHIALARGTLKHSPGDPAALLSLAEALVRYHERTGQGRLSDALAAARKARARWPDAPETWFWEGLAHHLAGRTPKAQESLRRFLRSPAVRRRGLRPLTVEARGLLERDGAA